MTARAVSRYYLTGETFGADSRGRDRPRHDRGRDVDAELTVRSCDALRACSPQGLAETKPLTTAATRAAFDAGAEDMQALSQRLFESDEAREGILSFLEKRPPRWAAP